MIVEKNNIDVPDHLNLPFFQEVIEKVINRSGAKVLKVAFTMASSPGDNYTSRVYRVCVTYILPKSEETSVSVIIKSIPPIDSPNQPDIFDVYKRETLSYFKVHHLVKELLPDLEIGPKCYHAVRNSYKTLIFEDLKAQNYRTVRREHGLDEPHARMVLEKLAKYHAATMMFCEKDPEIYSEFKQCHFTEEMMDNAMFQNVFNENLREVTYLAEKWPGYEAIVQKLRLILANFKKVVLGNLDASKDSIKVLNHGDLWTANIMFQYDGEKTPRPKDVIFVDFQIGYVASPGFDINYFLNTSVQLDVLKNTREELITHYYASFSATLKKLGYKDIPSLNLVQSEIHRKELYGLISLCSVAPVVCCDPKYTQDNSLETIVDEAKFNAKRAKMFSSQRLIETMQYSLKRFDKLKVLDIVL